MLPYWILFALPAWLALSSARPVDLSSSSWSQIWKLFFVFLVLMIGLRYNVGGDWYTYLDKVQQMRYVSLRQLLTFSGNTEASYSLLNWIAFNTTFGVYFVNTACAAFFSWGLIEFCRNQPRPWLAVVVAVPYLIIVVCMGYTRQGTAIGFAMLGMLALSDQKFFRFVLFIILAASFHRASIILFPLAALSHQKNKIWTVSWVLILSVILYSLFLESSLDRLNHGYVDNKLMSAGAGIRVAMNAVPAIIFLVNKNRFGLSKNDKIYWMWMSMSSLFFLILLQSSTSSTMVDRLALYMIPLQLFVLSRVPELFGKLSDSNFGLVLAVVVYSALVLFVWLFFAVHAGAWLPYQFYPLVWLTE